MTVFALSELLLYSVEHKSVFLSKVAVHHGNTLPQVGFMHSRGNQAIQKILVTVHHGNTWIHA